MINSAFWNNKKVFLTGHTGFKGAWLSLWLSGLGARITGYALEPPTTPSLFEIAHVHELVDTHTADVRDAESLAAVMRASEPDIVIHMAAQALVGSSYRQPIETYSTNVMGTVHLFEAVRRCPSVGAVINVTTDKCYENQEWMWGYRENDPMGGADPYSNSKACSELITAAYRSSFFNASHPTEHRVGIATARAGNVIGGGDWAANRLIPDCIRAFLAGKPVLLRRPDAIRPWQHVLEPLSGYLTLARRLYEKKGTEACGAWNFGPTDEEARSVEWIVRNMCELWRDDASYVIDEGAYPHETNCLKLDCSKARIQLGWCPRWDLSTALDHVVAWAKAYQAGRDMRTVCFEQIESYEAAAIS